MGAARAPTRPGLSPPRPAATNRGPRDADFASWGGNRSQRKQPHHPAEDDRGTDEHREHLGAEPRLLAGCVLRDRREDQRDEKREQQHQAEVAGHYFRPSRTSYASIATSMLRSPDTIRNVLP